MTEQRDHAGHAVRDAAVVVPLGGFGALPRRQQRRRRVPGDPLAGDLAEPRQVIDDAREPARRGRVPPRAQPLDEVHADADQPLDQIVVAGPAIDGELRGQRVIDLDEKRLCAVVGDVRHDPARAGDPVVQRHPRHAGLDRRDQLLDRGVVARRGDVICVRTSRVGPEQRELARVHRERR